MSADHFGGRSAFGSKQPYLQCFRDIIGYDRFTDTAGFAMTISYDDFDLKNLTNFTNLINCLKTF